MRGSHDGGILEEKIILFPPSCGASYLLLIMPTVCCVFSCSNNNKKEGISLYRIPAILHNQGDEVNELSERRRNGWLSAIHRDDEKHKKTEHWRVCSDHFLSGKPASLFQKDHPDWLPTLKLGHVTKEKSFESEQRYARVLGRRQKKLCMSVDDVTKSCSISACNQTVDSGEKLMDI